MEVTGWLELAKAPTGGSSSKAVKSHGHKLTSPIFFPASNDVKAINEIAKNVEDADAASGQMRKVFKPHELTALDNAGWQVAMGPMKAVGMNFVMLRFMGGSGIGIMGLFMLAYAGYGLMQAIWAFPRAFVPVENQYAKQDPSGTEPVQKGNLVIQKLAYVASCIAAGIYLVYTAITMGIIPFTAADFRSQIEPLTIQNFRNQSGL